MRETAVIYDEIRAARVKREAEIERLKKKAAEAAAGEQKAKDKAKEALARGDEAAYTKAKAEGRTAADKIEFNNEILSRISNSPLYTPEAGAKILDEIRAGLDARTDKDLSITYRRLKECESTIDALFSEMDKADKAAKDLGSDSCSDFNKRVALQAVGRNVRGASSVGLFDKYKTSGR